MFCFFLPSYCKFSGGFSEQRLRIAGYRLAALFIFKSNRRGTFAQFQQTDTTLSQSAGIRVGQAKGKNKTSDEGRTPEGDGRPRGLRCPSGFHPVTDNRHRGFYKHKHSQRSKRSDEKTQDVWKRTIQNIP